MVINDLKSSLKKRNSARKEEDKDEGDDDLYNLVRGKRSTLTIQRLDEKGEDDYKPQRRVIMVVSSSNSEEEDYTPQKPSSQNGQNKKIKTEKKHENVGSR
jgi:hypothetical protein